MRKRERERERDLTKGFNVGVYGGVEASKGIVAGDVEILLLFDVVSVVLLADRLYSCQDFDDAHLLLWFVSLLLPSFFDCRVENKSKIQDQKIKFDNFFFF